MDFRWWLGLRRQFWWSGSSTGTDLRDNTKEIDVPRRDTDEATNLTDPIAPAIDEQKPAGCLVGQLDTDARTINVFNRSKS